MSVSSSNTKSNMLHLSSFSTSHLTQEVAFLLQPSPSTREELECFTTELPARPNRISLQQPHDAVRIRQDN